uniref:Uncharacterized protein n=1 Tax=Oryza nivara TaxID=4536 RepID=A0A0E0HWL4_ORYNI
MARRSPPAAIFSPVSTLPFSLSPPLPKLGEDAGAARGARRDPEATAMSRRSPPAAIFSPFSDGVI